MRVNIFAKNITVTDAIKEYSEKKISKLEKYFEDGDVQINFEVVKNIHIVEILVDVKGMFLKGFDRSEDLYTSIDFAIDKIEKQLVKYRDKIRTRKPYNHKPEDTLFMDVYDTETIHDDSPSIVISKSIPSKPMDIDEAVMQMNLLNKEFFVFNNIDGNEINVVYKRDDGNIGLIKDGH